MIVYYPNLIRIVTTRLITGIDRLPIGAILFFSYVFITSPHVAAQNQSNQPQLRYTVSMPNPESHVYQVELTVSRWRADSVRLKMPRWTPGYYQILDYANAVSNVTVTDATGVTQAGTNAWVVRGIKNKSFTLRYNVKAEKVFVAQCLLDSTHGYIVPAGLFVYPDKRLDLPVSVTLKTPSSWKIVTGLEQGKTSQEFTAPDFDILYDCPILMGPLEELPAFTVRGIKHRFIGYAMGDFDRAGFMNKLQKVVTAAVEVIGDIPFEQYTFIGIGPGRGGIEHLNNTTVSFDGKGLDTPEGMNRMLNFLAHEYFHHYNVKRIRPLELGPFDYDKGSKTNLLWVSEGLSVYYEYLAVKRAGMADERTVLDDFGHNINALENNPGKAFQSLQQASYETWSDGPFGTQGKAPGQSISYYVKGPVVGMLLDFAIRNATQNKKSLDDVMRFLYNRYYKELRRGFSDAEFEQACETIAGTRLTTLFEYVYTTKELDYTTYLGYAGLNLVPTSDANGKPTFTLQRMPTLTPMQNTILTSWLGN